jgi:hypothetical protein
MNDMTPQAVQACHELIRWLVPQLDKFPRLRRYTLGERLELARHLWRLAHEQCRVEQAQRFHQYHP